jgi:hypothetical protein
VALFIYAVAGIAVLALERASMSARVSKAFVTGRAAIAIGDSGVFATPVLPRGARLTIPHADAESAAVALGYWEAPSVQDLTALPYYEEIPLERRHFCGRTYYVQPIVAMPDTNVIHANSGNVWEMWAPTWVMPICDDREQVRTTVSLSDVPVGGLRVIQGSRPGDIPRLVTPPRSFPHIGSWSSRIFRDWEHGIGMTPETAVNVAMARLRGTGARVAEVPEAFTLIVPPNAWQRAPGDSQAFTQTAECSRWRLTLDRAVALRGLVTGRIVHTSTVYVTRGDDGCHGIPALEIPKPSQPTSVPVMYMIPHPGGPDSLLPRQRRRPSQLPGFDPSWTRVRVVEPIMFEPARAP